MAAHPYNLRSRVSSPGSARTPTATSTPKGPLNSFNKFQNSPISLRLEHVVGTTAKNQSGLSACAAANTFAYCAGSTTVLAQVDESETVSHRYYRARPAAVPLNPSISYYASPLSTPTRKRASLMTPRKEQETIPSTRTYLEDENAKTWTARERIKTVKSVALSPNGRFLAVGESGYNPRVLLFSTARDASTEIPLSIISDHTWGVKCVAFSPDSRFLATLGESNDGFLFIWNVNPKTGSVKLCATNKCTSNICHMTWCGQQLITVGTRHVKVWQVPSIDRSSPGKRSRIRDIMLASPSGSPSPLAGRNCLLGDLVDLTFTCAASVSDQHVLICTDIGLLCVADVSKSPAELAPLDPDSCPASAIGFREAPRRLVWAGGGGDLHEIGVDGLLGERTAQFGLEKADASCTGKDTRILRKSALPQYLGLSQLNTTGTLAVSCLTKHTIYIDADSNLVLTPANSESQFRDSKPLLSHNEPVQGVRTLDAKAGLGAFFTWSKNGEVRFWDAQGQLLRVEQIELDDGSDVEEAASNELKVLRHSEKSCFLSGDRFGVLKLTKAEDWQLLHTARAHSAEVNDICFDNASEYVATCSRDRMVQVFSVRETSLDLLQTTDDHIAAVNQVTFSNDSRSLLSCSADRTIVVREKASREYGREIRAAFLQTRIITIKASPLSMCLAPERDDVLYVSALDRQITKIDFLTGTIMESFKVADGDSDDHAVLNAIQVSTSLEMGTLRNLLIGCSSTDKSVRVYDLQKQSLLSKESAHTEGISDVTLLGHSAQDLQPKRTFVSTGHDSTIMLWSVVANAQLLMTPTIEFTQDQAMTAQGSDSTPAKVTPASLPPLRKVLTKLDLAEFVKPLSPRSPSLRDPSPARSLRRKGSKLGLASSAIKEADKNVPPALKRRSSADERAKIRRRSPSPPPYATRRQKMQTTRGEVTKDFYSRQSEWLRQSPEPADTPISSSRQEPKANKARMRRPPSVPTDLRTRTFVPERRSSTLVPQSEFGSISMASEQACRMLKTYKKKLQNANGDFDLNNIEDELEAVLEVVRKKRAARKPSAPTVQEATKAGPPPRLKRSTTTPSMSPSDRKQSASTPGSEANSPMSGSGSAISLGSEATEKGYEKTRITSNGAGLGVDGLSILLEKTNLAEA